jgi:O-antigen/teichoic acid export membrane protein
MNRNTNPQEVTFLGDFSKKLVTNTLFNLIGRSWSFLVTLLLTPYILAHLNVGEFGVWVLLGIFTTTFNLLDLGLGSSFVKYISAYYTHEDYDRINQVIFSGLAFYGAFGLLLTVLGLALEQPLFRVFRIEGASDVYLLVLISYAMTNIAAMLLSVFKGMQRMDKSNSVEIRMSILNVIGTVLFLEFGFGMLGLAMTSLICSIIAVCVAWVTLRRMMPKVRLGWHFNGMLLREMFAYGAKMQVSRLGGLVCFQLDKLIISRVLGVASVSFYEVSSRLTSFMRAVPLVMVSALIPATSELGARNDRERILRTYYLASKYVAMMTVAMVSYVVLEARSLVNLWIGPGFEDSVVLIQVLAIGYGANVLGASASQTGAGVGRPEFDMRSTVLLAVVNPILSLLLVREFGAPGAALGTSIALVISAGYLLIAFHREYLEDSVWSMFRDIQIRPILAAMLANLAVVGFHQLAPRVADFQEIRYLVVVKMALDFAIFATVYTVVLIALRQLTVMDWKNFMGIAALGFELLRHPFRERSFERLAR